MYFSFSGAVLSGEAFFTRKKLRLVQHSARRLPLYLKVGGTFSSIEITSPSPHDEIKQVDKISVRVKQLAERFILSRIHKR
jgi:hypothetical protein